MIKKRTATYLLFIRLIRINGVASTKENAIHPKQYVNAIKKKESVILIAIMQYQDTHVMRIIVLNKILLIA